MSKFKVRFNLEKLSLEIEGERDTIPAVTDALKQQFGGLIQSPATVAIDQPRRIDAVVTPSIEDDSSNRRKRRTRTADKTENGGAAIDFRHDAEKWGAPKQDWTTLQKAIWLLYVVRQQTPTQELSSNAITETFNKHFRQAKEILRGNVGRDLGKAKVQNPSLVGEDTSKSPSAWYLTTEGERLAQKLIVPSPA